MRKLTCLIFLLWTTSAFTQSPLNLKLDRNGYAKIAQEIGAYPIICLGEETHWVESYLEVKVELIRHLHEQQGFNTLIFESGFVNAFMSYWYGLEQQECLQESLYDIWHTTTTLRLYNYQAKQEHSGTPIWFWGCDIKGPKSFLFSRFLKELFHSLNPVYAEELSKVDSSFIETRGRWEPAIGEVDRGVYLSSAKADRIKSFYIAALDSLKAQKGLLFESNNHTTNDAYKFLERCLQNRLYLLQLMQLPTYQQKHQFRDSIMAENTYWLIENWSQKDQKYLIWGADIHLSKNAKWEANGDAWKNNRSLVEHLQTKTSKPIFSIGIKPRKRLDKESRQSLGIKSSGVYWLSKNTLPEEARMPFGDEHDALIICGRTRALDKIKKK